MKNLPMDLLRTFVTINDLGGFTQAGEVLGRSQPAVSLQVKRLEELVSVQLFNRAQGLRLTEEGQMLYGYARKILDLNDTAVSRVMTPAVSGSVRLGIPNDFEVSFLPVLLSKFSRAYPNVMLDVSSDLSVHLRRDYLRGAFDLVMSMDEHPSSEILADDAIVEPLAWISGADFHLDPAEPVPLVLYPKGCVYRHHVTEALNQAGIAWRILYCTSSLLGIQSAIEAGLGISALANNTVPGMLKADKVLGHLPPLGDVTIGFNYDAANLSAAGKRLLEHLRQGLQQSQLYHPPKRI
ncbi:LysR substrate-binding domain-containing protein [Marinobacterium rhizophilum]|uniref:LysR substrate-binding domain-containing protein n=1 Tax=Marinobacterium rhizophilum TaxID=420402 RepID=UPI000374256A|nr:LysR substrate-binding domain-containing protein [Marinobacterium rhizophilum]